MRKVLFGLDEVFVLHLCDNPVAPSVEHFTNGTRHVGRIPALIASFTAYAARVRSLNHAIHIFAPSNRVCGLSLRSFRFHGAIWLEFI